MNIKQDVLPLFTDTWSEFQKDEVGRLGAALAYYAMFSIFPLLLLLIAVLGFVLRNPSADASRQQILSIVGHTFSPQLSDTLGSVLEGVRQQAGTATAIGLLTLLLGASGVFQQLDVTFNKIWKVPPPAKKATMLATAISAVTERLLSFGMVLAVCFLLLISLALTGVTQALLQGAGMLLGLTQQSSILVNVGVLTSMLITLLLDGLIFGMLFRFLPRTVVRWKDVWLGALLTALIWEIGKRLLAIYIGRSSYASAYGAVGTVLVLMAWIFFSSQIMFLGAEFTRVYAERHGSRKRAATPVQPAPASQPVITEHPPASTRRTLAVATGTGLLVGAISGAIAGSAALLIGIQRAVTLGSRRLRR